VQIPTFIWTPPHTKTTLVKKANKENLKKILSPNTSGKKTPRFEEYTKKPGKKKGSKKKKKKKKKITHPKIKKKKK